MHVCFYNQGLGDTGGVRVMLDMAHMLHQNGIKVSIITNIISKVAFELPEFIDLYYLSKSNLRKVDLDKDLQNNCEQDSGNKNNVRSFFSRIPFCVRVKKKIQYITFLLIHKPELKKNLEDLNVDCFISLNMYSFLEVTELFSEIANTILHIHNDPQEVYSRKNYTETISLSRLYQNENIKLVCISEEQKEILSNYLKVSPSRVQVIYNSINFTRIETLSKSEQSTESEYVLGLGSLTTRKRFDRLILACIETKNLLLVIGDGPEKQNLELLVKKKNAENLIKFLGFVENPYPFIKKASSLVLTSQSEGLPTVIIEAIYLNTVVLSTACQTGPKELLMNEASQLVSLNQSEENIQSEIQQKLSELPTTNPKHIKESLQRFSFACVQKSWLDIIENEK